MLDHSSREEFQTDDCEHQPATPPAPRFIPITIRISAGQGNAFRALDLSRAGCMFDRQIWGVREGQRVWVSFPTLSNLRATIAWVEDDMAGLVFDDLLHEAVYEHLRRPLDF